MVVVVELGREASDFLEQIVYLVAGRPNPPSDRTSATSCTRCFGSFSKHRRSNVLSLGGVSAGSLSQSGSSRRTAPSVSETSRPWNGRVPDNIS